MKPYLLIPLILISFISFAQSQVSVAAGVTAPLGAFADQEHGAANPGYQMTAFWDKPLFGQFGISSGILLGLNSRDGNATNSNLGLWTLAIAELGLMVKPIDNLKIKSLITKGIYATPSFQYESNAGNSGGGATYTKLSFGLDVRIEYQIKKFFVGANLLHANPKFETLHGKPLVENSSMTLIGLLIGYSF